MADDLQSLTVQLRDRLRVLRQSPVPEPEPAPASLPRALVATRLLAHRSTQADLPDQAAWFTALLGMLVWVQAHRVLAPVACERALRDLAAFEESLLQHLDAGRDLAPLVRAEHLASLQDSLLAVVTPTVAAGGAVQPWRNGFLAAATWLKETLESAPAPETAPTWPDHAVPALWQRLRSLGDALLVPSSGPVPDAGPILVLADGCLLTTALLHRLQEATLQVARCASVPEAMTRLREGARLRAVICDNVEPTLHLWSLHRALVRAGLQLPAPLLLATGSHRRSVQRYAQRLGARGIWSPPHLITDLRGLLEETD